MSDASHGKELQWNPPHFCPLTSVCDVKHGVLPSIVSPSNRASRVHGSLTPPSTVLSMRSMMGRERCTGTAVVVGIEAAAPGTVEAMGAEDAAPGPCQISLPAMSALES